MIRFGILAGVSTDMQARDDKASIPDQVATCRRAILHLGGKEVALYTMDGYSRTGYDSLADAMNDIPPLKDAIEAAAAGEYDVLILDNWDRLGDLGQLVHTRFKRYRKQIYSARQSGRLYDPRDYDPHMDESSGIDMHIQGIIQQYRIAKLHRGWDLGIRRRVENGLHSQGWPFGYKKGEGGQLVIDPPAADLVIRLKDAYLAGTPLRELVDLASRSGVPTRKGGVWTKATLRTMLINPFYAGFVFRNRWTSSNGRHWSKMNPDPALYPGRHPALWSFEEYQRIVEEMGERYRHSSRHNTRNFSGLLQCSVCGKRLIFKLGKYRCSHHVLLPGDQADLEIGPRLVEALRAYTSAPPPEPPPDTTADAIAAVEKQIARVQKGYEEEIYTAGQAREKIDALKVQIAGILKHAEDREQRAARHARLYDMQNDPRLATLPDYLIDPFPLRNNRFLRELVSAIVVTPGHEYTFTWR